MSVPLLSEILSMSMFARDVQLVQVEVAVRRGLPMFQILGLASQNTKESKDRIKISIETSGFQFPFDSIIINLHPNHIQKKSSFFDLPIAICILKATGQVSLPSVEDLVALGSLSLSGTVIGSEELLELLWRYPDSSSKTFLLPEELKDKNLPKAKYRFLSSLQDLVQENYKIVHSISKQGTQIELPPEWDQMTLTPDQMLVFQGLCYASLGNHHALVLGNPGNGKTKLVKMLKDIQANWLENEIINGHLYNHSNNEYALGEIGPRPFRAPHHTTTEQALVGGGYPIEIGEVTRAHGGILFLDELSEFKERSLEVLREPMEEKKINVSRLHNHKSLPADCVIIGVTNPCPCGNYLGFKNCPCSKKQIRDYLRKFSGAFLDRISIHLRLFDKEESRSVIIYQKEFKERMNRAKIFQAHRFVEEKKYKKSDILDQFSNNNFSKLDLGKFSFRRKQNFIKLTRTIADFELSEIVLERHILEALDYSSNSLFFEEIN